MAWLLMLPAWMKVAAASLLVVGVLQVRHWLEIRGLHRQIEQAQVDLALEKSATVELRIGISELSANRDKLAATIREQNAAIERLQTAGQLAEAEALVRVARAREAGRLAAEALRAPTSTVPPGHAAMNQWLQERFW